MLRILACSHRKHVSVVDTSSKSSLMGIKMIFHSTEGRLEVAGFKSVRMRCGGGVGLGSGWGCSWCLSYVSALTGYI